MSILGSIITPALVAGTISLIVTDRFEKVRARRDFITKAFDPARDAVRAAVEAAIEYFPEPASGRTLKLEAKVIASEREVRRAISSVLSLHTDEKTKAFLEADEAYAIFVAELTSGTFQQKSAKADLATTIRVADAGSKLRATLVILRSEVFDRAIDKDIISKVSRFPRAALDYLNGRP